ncbi:MAG: adenylosuccinate synthase [Anaerohalosphaeraceae bacterium]|nr:adenylosuccinate synthase [Anaerohalosphaeraceae bacterium]
MNNCVVGLQWGDEGKGKVVDILAAESDIVVRYGGGANAGHTVVVGDTKFALHLLPSGSIRKEAACVIANGVVVDPEVLLGEIESLAKQNISLNDRLFISENAHVVLDYHKTEDRLREEALGKNKIGTTIRGIGPCYADKTGRSYAVRVADFRNLERLKAKIEKIVAYKNKLFSALYEAPPIDADEIFEKCKIYAEKLAGYITDTTAYLHEAIDSGKSLLFEGAQGALLDLDHGTFPFVTSSNASSLGMSAGCGVPAQKVDRFIGVVKAYSTRVGAGPFPSELDNEIGQTIRDRGHEYGTTTGRPRRCGWFDAMAVKYTSKIGGINEIAMMHIDTLAGFDEVKICGKYTIDGREIKMFPSDGDELAKVQCHFETLKGWGEVSPEVSEFEQLPKEAQQYIKRVEQLVGLPVMIIGVGPKRSQTIFRK